MAHVGDRPLFSRFPAAAVSLSQLLDHGNVNARAVSCRSSEVELPSLFVNRVDARGDGPSRVRLPCRRPNWVIWVVKLSDWVRCLQESGICGSKIPDRAETP